LNAERATLEGRRPLGRTGLRVSALGLAKAFGPWTWVERVQRLRPEDVERAFHDSGVNVFLVSPRMQEICEGVRRLIRDGQRERIVLVSGQGLPTAGSARRALERQLRLLGTDHLDLWLMGYVRGRWYVRDDVWSAMTRLREQGKTRAIGFSAHDRPLAARLARELPADAIMVRYNASHRGAEREVFDALADLGARRPGIIAYTATRWGMLLRPLPQRGFPHALTGAECYRFVLGHPAVDMVWCAAATAEQLREDVTGARLGPLDERRTREVRRFGDAVHEAARFGRRWMFGATSA
jgi:aryl-alcohol dehydrogenase-like predicted oxidoreductase